MRYFSLEVSDKIYFSAWNIIVLIPMGCRYRFCIFWKELFDRIQILQ
jgi:hypothetical protein